MSYEEFRKHIDTARQILVGAVPSPAGQIDQITYALMYKFMNDIDDQSAALGGKRTYFAGDYTKYNWHELMKPGLEAHEQLELYRQAIQGMSKNPGLPPLFREIYQNAFLPFNSPSVLRLFLDEINKFNHGDSDDIGDAYEYLLSITGAQGDVGQFRTPRHIIKFIVEAVNPAKGDSVLDPAVGTAGFLIAAYNHVKAQHDGRDDQGNASGEKQLTSDELEKLHHNYRGFDIDPTMVRTASVNLYLHGFTSHNTVINHDSLSSEDYWKDKYDVILANPPFMTPKGGIQPHKKFSISANRAEVLFVDYIASHLKPNGRAGVIVPEGIIFQSGKAYKELRKNLVENYLYAVVSLPAGVFQPYSGVKTSILLLDKQLAKERKDIMFVKVENDGYTLGAQRRRDMLNDQLPQSLDFIKLYQANRHQDAPHSHAVSRKEIAESGDYNLNGERYRIVPLANEKWGSVELQSISDLIQRGKTPIYGSSKVQVIKSGQARGYFSFDFTTRYFVDTTFVIDHRKLQKGDILINSTGVGTAGRVTLFNLDGDYLVDGHITIVRLDRKKALPEYVLHALADGYGFAKLESMARGNGGQIELSLSTIKGLTIPLLPIEVQQEVVAELESYQKIIDAAKTVVKTYKPIIDINPDWKAVALGDLFDMQNGRAFKTAEWTDDGMPIIRIANLNSEEAKYNYFNGEYDDKILVRPGDLLFSWSGTRGTSFGPHLWKRRPGLLNQHIFRMLPKNEDIDPIFAYYSLERIVPQIESKAHGSGGLVHITKRELNNFTIPLPPIEVQHEIVAELEAEQKLIDSNKKLIEVYQRKVRSKLAEIWGE